MVCHRTRLINLPLIFTLKYMLDYILPVMIRKSVKVLLALMCFLPHAAFSQQTAVYAEPDATYRSAKELFDKEKYGAARQLFLQVIEQADDQRGEISANAQLYAAISAYELFNPDAGEQLMAFVE